MWIYVNMTYMNINSIMHTNLIVYNSRIVYNSIVYNKTVMLIVNMCVCSRVVNTLNRYW